MKRSKKPVILFLFLIALLCSCKLLTEKNKKDEKSATVHNDEKAIYYKQYEMMSNGTIALKNGLFDSALSIFSEYVSLYPDDYDGYLFLGLTHIKMNKLDEAFETFEESLKTKNIEDKSHISLKWMAAIRYEQKNYVDASNYYSMSIERTPENEDLADLHLWRGRAYFELGDFDKSMLDMNISIKYKPENADAYFYRAYIFYLQEKYTEAFTNFYKAKSLGYECVELENILADLLDYAEFEPHKIFIGELNLLNESGEIVIPNIYFDTDKYELKEESETILLIVLNYLLENPDLVVEITGHTDNTGSYEHNVTLSQNRAKSVYEFLVSNGVFESRLQYKGYADTKPIDSNNTPEGRAKNRRIEMKLIEN